MKSYLSLCMLLSLLLGSCAGNSQTKSECKLTSDQIAVFTSTDEALQKSYEWAKRMSLSYSHDGGDPVGYWYEAALPKREAFCMRDVSHQSVAAQILGLRQHNKNMFSLFVRNISESKDWCSYWEINRYNNPVPADYLNDKEFWYNLNANFDVMQACLKMYHWTGDTDYVSDESFSEFFERTAKDYLSRWSLEPENIMSRPAYLNKNEEFDMGNSFHTCRGLPSYVENMPGISSGVDLIAALYGGFTAYGRISEINGNAETADSARIMAGKYRDILENEWWDAEKSRYFTGRLEDGTFTRGEGVPFILWFDATENEERIRMALDDIAGCEWNVENLSHFPALFYKYGYCDEAYDYLINLPALSRAEYPEVSFGFIEGCVCGAMGFKPSYADKSVETISRLKGIDTDSEIRNIDVFDGYMSVHHVGNCDTEISNDTSVELTWKASFIGDYPWIEVEGKRYPAKKDRDLKGNTISFAEVNLKPNSKLKAKALEETPSLAFIRK